MSETKVGQRITGLVFLVIGAAMTTYAWYCVLHEVSMCSIFEFGPAVVFIGINCLFFPMDVAEFRERTGKDSPEVFSEYPMINQIIFYVGIGAGVLNVVAIKMYLS